MIHGLMKTYKHAKCRCDLCKTAKREQSRKEREQDPEKVAEYMRRYNEKNRATLSEKNREWRRANHAAILAKKARYREANREALAAKQRAYNNENIEETRERGRKRYYAKKDAQIAPFTTAQLAERMAYYGNRCYLRLPGICTGAFDEVEHVKPISKGGAHALANLRPSCLPCNRYKSNKWPFPAGPIRRVA